MNIEILQPTLKQGIAVVGRAVAGKSTLPALSHILVAAEEDGMVRLSATNLSIGLIAWLPARVQVTAAVCLPAKLMADVIGGLPDSPIRITVDTQRASAELSSGPIGRDGHGQFESTVKGVEADEFPVLPEHDTPELLTLRSDVLARALNAVTYAAATDDTRPVLSGVSILITHKQVRFTTADGFRSVRYVIDLEPPIGLSQNSINLLPEATAMMHLAGILNSTKEPVDVKIRISQNAGQVSFDVAGAAGLSRVVLIARQIEGTFPDVDRLVPVTHDRRAIVDLGKFRSIVKMASFFALESAKHVRLDMKPGEEGPGEVAVYASAAEIGRNQAGIDALVVGEAGSVQLNVTFLAGTLAALTGNLVAIEMQSPAHPAVFRPVGVDSDNELHMLMPINVR